MKKGDVIQLEIEDVAYGAEGLGRHDGRVVFVSGALPGEQVEARIFKKKRDFAHGRLTALLQASPHRLQAPCPHFGTCGGCRWQDVDYDYQLQLKRDIVVETLRRLGGFSEIPVGKTTPSPRIFAYRNKMEFSFSNRRWILTDESDPPAKPVDFSLGLHIPGRFDKVLDIETCLLQDEFANKILTCVKEFAQGSGRAAWDSRAHEGFWRFLVMRWGQNTGESMVNIVTFDHDRPLMQSLTNKLLADVPAITSIVNNVTRSLGGSAFGEKEHALHGPPVIAERLGDFTFSISANSFFQTNTTQAENLYQTTLEYADLGPEDVVYDLYCGTGTIAVFLSPFAKTVIGVEAIPSAIENAIENAKRNKAQNCTFVQGDMKDILGPESDLVIRFGRPDIVILDPPRAGLHPKAVAGVSDLGPEKIVYVSCNPTTFARDARSFADAGYELTKVQPVDMFPHTYHIELVALLVRR